MCLYAAVTGLRKFPLLNLEHAWVDGTRLRQKIPGWAMKGGEDRWGDDDFTTPLCRWAAELAAGRGRWVFPNPKTRRPNGQVDRSLWRIAAAAGIPRFSLHDLRNTFASILADRGVHEQVIAVLMGHAAASVTRDYIKRQPTALSDAVAIFDAIRYEIAKAPANVARFRNANHLKESSGCLKPTSMKAMADRRDTS
jgi:integrase